MPILSIRQGYLHTFFSAPLPNPQKKKQRQTTFTMGASIDKSRQEALKKRKSGAVAEGGASTAKKRVPFETFQCLMCSIVFNAYNILEIVHQSH